MAFKGFLSTGVPILGFPKWTLWNPGAPGMLCGEGSHPQASLDVVDCTPACPPVSRFKVKVELTAASHPAKAPASRKLSWFTSSQVLPLPFRLLQGPLVSLIKITLLSWHNRRGLFPEPGSWTDGPIAGAGAQENPTPALNALWARL